MSKVQQEAKKEATKIMKKHLHHISGVPEWLILVFHKGDSHVETARKCSIETVKELLREHSCETLLNERWAFWSQVEIELNTL